MLTKNILMCVHFDDEDENKAFESIRCFKNQNTQQEIDEWIDAEKRTQLTYFISENYPMRKGLILILLNNDSANS